jgi:chromate transporter
VGVHPLELEISADEPKQPNPSLMAVARYWAWMGATAFGGLYAMLPRLQSDLEERGWVSREDFDTIMAAATLVPGPSFVALGGLVGYRLRGAVGSLVSMTALLLPSTVLVAAAITFMSQDTASGPMATITRLVTVAMGGVLLGNAWTIMRSARLRWAGLLLLLATGGAILAGVSVMGATIAALIVGRFLIGGKPA